jgi:hypothetical protein
MITEDEFERMSRRINLIDDLMTSPPSADVYEAGA